MAATDTIEFHGIFQENLGALVSDLLKLLEPATAINSLDFSKMVT